MGDRANIYLVDSEAADSGIYLYTHWNGSEWPESLRTALDAGRGRWGDSAYLARIIVSKVYSDIHDRETGGGIGTTMPDNTTGRPIIICDLERSEVAFAAEGSERNRAAWTRRVPFAQYVATPADYPEVSAS